MMLHHWFNRQSRECKVTVSEHSDLLRGYNSTKLAAKLIAEILVAIVGTAQACALESSRLPSISGNTTPEFCQAAITALHTYANVFSVLNNNSYTKTQCK